MATAAPSELLEIPQATELEGLYEVVNGQIVEKPTMGSLEGVLASLLFKAMARTQNIDEIGWLVCEVLFQLDSTGHIARCPDLAFVSFDRWPQDRSVPRKRAWNVVPDLAVEVVSDSNTANEMVQKVEEYFRSGVRMAWLFYTNVQKVYVYRSPAEITVLTRSDTLDGGILIPGFRVSLSHLFPDLGEAEESR